MGQPAAVADGAGVSVSVVKPRATYKLFLRFIYFENWP